MNLDPDSLPEALQDNPPRVWPRHPAWTLEEQDNQRRATNALRLRRAVELALLAILAILALKTWGAA